MPLAVRGKVTQYVVLSSSESDTETRPRSKRNSVRRSNGAASTLKAVSKQRRTASQTFRQTRRSISAGKNSEVIDLDGDDKLMSDEIPVGPMSEADDEDEHGEDRGQVRESRTRVASLRSRDPQSSPSTPFQSNSPSKERPRDRWWLHHVAGKSCRCYAPTAVHGIK
jgi:hypothetical protein